MQTDSFLTNTDTETENAKLVDGPKLLELLFQPECRPTIRWLRDQQKARRIPFVKIGRLVFFNPAQVQEALAKQATAK